MDLVTGERYETNETIQSSEPNEPDRYKQWTL